MKENFYSKQFNKLARLSFLLSFLTLQACGQRETQSVLNAEKENIKEDITASLIDPKGTIIKSRILVPSTFQRLNVEQKSFAEYLRNLPLKAHNSEVKFYNGDLKTNQNVYDAVVALPIGKKDLHQCADAVMRLRAEYLFKQKQFDKIHFNFTNGFRVDYSQWMKGMRIVVKGNSTSWKKSAEPSSDYENFWSYMEMIFSYAGTLSLSKELKSVQLEKMNIGDVFIQGGSPGHAVIVVDMAVNNAGEKLFLLAQSYMPAQEIQILKNPNDNNISPWYSLDFDGKLYTPEWTFDKTDLKRFEE